MTLLTSTQETDQKQRVKDFFEQVWQKGNAELTSEFCHSNLVYHKSSWGGRGSTGDLDQLKNSVVRFHENFSAPEIQIQDIIAGEDGKVTVRWNLSSNSKREEQNEKLITTGIHIYQLAEGKISQVWVVNLSNFSYDF